MGFEAQKPEVKASDVFLCGLHPKCSKVIPRDLCFHAMSARLRKGLRETGE